MAHEIEKGRKTQTGQNQGRRKRPVLTEQKDSVDLESKSTGRRIREAIRLKVYSLGHSVELVGRNFRKSWMSKIGVQVKKMGDRIELMGRQNDNTLTTKGLNL